MNIEKKTATTGKPQNANKSSPPCIQQLYKAIYEFNHKLLQPMQVIMGHAQLLVMESSEGSKQYERLNIILAQITKIKEMNIDLRLTTQTHEEQMES